MSWNHEYYQSYLCYCCKMWFCISCISEYIFTFFVMCVCLFVFHKVASLLGLCLFWQPATAFMYFQLCCIVFLFMMWQMKFSLSLSPATVKCDVRVEPKFSIFKSLPLNRGLFGFAKMTATQRVSKTGLFKTRIYSRQKVNNWVKPPMDPT